MPNLWRVLAINPVQLEAVWTALKSLMHPEAVGRKSPLDPATRETIAGDVEATKMLGRTYRKGFEVPEKV